MNYRMIDQMVEVETRLVIEMNALYKAILMATARALGSDKFLYNTETGVFSMNVYADDDKDNMYHILFIKDINNRTVSVVIDREGIGYAHCTIDVSHKYHAEFGRIPSRDVRMMTYDLFNAIADISRDVIDQFVIDLTPRPAAPTSEDRPITEMVHEESVEEAVVEEAEVETKPEGVTPAFVIPEEPKDETETAPSEEEKVIDVEPKKVEEDKPEEKKWSSGYTADGLSLDAVLNNTGAPKPRPIPERRPMEYTPPLTTPLTSRFSAGNEMFNALEAEMKGGHPMMSQSMMGSGNSRFSRNDPVSSMIPGSLLR